MVIPHLLGLSIAQELAKQSSHALTSSCAASLSHGGEYFDTKRAERMCLLVRSPMGWIYPPEVVPLYIRSKAVSLATSVNWAGNFSLTFFTPPAFKNIQWKVCASF